MTHRSVSNSISVSALVLALLATTACGGDKAPRPDVPETPTGTDLTIEIHRSFPFIDGDTADEARFVAVQDGDGEFVEVGGTDGVYTAHIESDRFGIAVACTDTEFGGIEIVQRVVADGTTYKTSCKSPARTATLDVTVQNLPQGNRLRLITTSALTPRNVGVDSTESIPVTPGNIELFATLTDSTKKVVKVFRLPPTAVLTTKAITIDVAAQGVAPDNLPLTVTPNDPAATVITAVIRPPGLSANLQGQGPALGATPTYAMLPTALRQSDDLYRITVRNDAGSHARTVKAPGNLAFTIPSAFVGAQTTLARTPFLRPTFTFAPTPAVLPNQTYRMDALTFTNTTRFLSVTVTPAWIAGAATLVYEFPDFSAFLGFATVSLVDREPIETSVTRSEDTGDFTVDGSESTSSTTATITLGEFCGDGATQLVETCDPGSAGGETATCDSDCTAVVCGDDITNSAAGEECDPPEAGACGDDCKVLP